MGRSAAIQSAIDAIGQEQEDDWVIDPVSHKERYQGTAPKLSSILSLQTVADTAQQYHDANSKADEYQLDFKRTVRHANVAVFLTACSGVAIAIAGTFLGVPAAEELPNAATQETGFGWVFIVLGMGGLVASALASMWLMRLRDGQKLKRWMNTRANAESRRIEYFTLVNDPDSRDDPELELLKLEYFRRYLLGSQIAYFGNRGGRHAASAKKTLNMSTAATAIAAILTGGAGLLASAMGHPYAALAGLGVIAAAFGAMISAREGLNQDAPNAKRYEVTKDKLVDIRKKYLEQVRVDTEDGLPDSYDNLFKAVCDVLNEEHALWLESGKLRNDAIDSLEDRLREVKNSNPNES